VSGIKLEASHHHRHLLYLFFYFTLFMDFILVLKVLNDIGNYYNMSLNFKKLQIQFDLYTM
jgi:hypothetical protein